MTTGTLRLASVPLGYGRALRLLRVDAGEEARLLLSVGFEDAPWPHPLADRRAIDVPAEAIGPLVSALTELAEEA